VEEENSELNEFLARGEDQNKKDAALINDIPMGDDLGTTGMMKLPKKSGILNPSGLSGMSGLRPTTRESKRLTGTYRNSIAFLKNQSVFNDINMVSSESMVLMYGMNEKYVDNLRNLNEEKEDLRRRTMGVRERERYTQRKSISA
jgi:hypothetical protein